MIWARVLFALGFAAATLAFRSSADTGTGSWQPVVNAGSNARLTDLAVTDTDVYVVDSNGWVVRRYLLHGLPRALEVTTVMELKESLGGVIGGRPLDLVVNRGNVLVLDDRGALWSYHPSTFTIAPLPVRLYRWQGSIRSVAVTDRILALGDSSGAIWRYQLTGGTISATSELVRHGGVVQVVTENGRLGYLDAHGSAWVGDASGTTWTRLPLPSLSAPWVTLPDGRLVGLTKGALYVADRDRHHWQTIVPPAGASAVAADDTGRLYVLTSRMVWRYSQAL